MKTFDDRLGFVIWRCLNRHVKDNHKFEVRQLNGGEDIEVHCRSCTEVVIDGSVEFIEPIIAELRGLGATITHVLGETEGG